MKKLYLVRTIILAGSLLLQLNTLCFHSRGAAGDVDLSFNPSLSANAYVFAVTVQPDGKVLVGGQFTAVNGTSRNNIARLNANGSLDSSFNPGTGINAGVSSVVVQSDGKVLVGGPFTTVNGTNRNCLARLNANGSLDSSFNPDLPLGVTSSEYDSAAANAVAVQPDGKVLVGEYFGMVRLSANGSLDGSFDPTIVAYGPIYSVVLQPDGTALIGGGFTAVNGTNRNGIARLNVNGSLDDTFTPGAGGYPVYSFALQLDGRVLIGGTFTAVNGTNRNHIARLNANGGLDSSFDPGTGADDVVRSIALQSDGKVLLGGDFLTVNGVARSHVVRLYGDSVAPTLSIAGSNAFMIVSWSMTGLNFQLLESTNFFPAAWSPVAQSAVTNASQISVTVPTAVGQKFFRLKSQ